MIKPTFFLSISLLFFSGFILSGQDSDRQEKWMRSQPAIMVQSDSGAKYSGQPIHTAIDTLYLLPAAGLPVGADWYGELQRIPFNSINHILLQRGGNSFTRAKHSVNIVLPDNDYYYTPEFQNIRNASVYSDSLVQPETLDEAFVHSKVMRQVFPEKHLRLSFGVGFGGDQIVKDAMVGLRNSSLPEPYSYDGRASADLLDVSWRFWDQYIVGGQLAARNLSYYLHGYDYIDDYADVNYGYDIYFSEYRLYAEYVFFPVDRFFKHRYELVAGAGFLIGKPNWSIYYNFNEYTEPDIWTFDEMHHLQEANLYGFQLRTAFHFYLFPGASLWGGVEGNFYQAWTIEAVEFPSSDPDAPILLPEHSLDFSGIRFKLGVSIYF